MSVKLYFPSCPVFVILAFPSSSFTRELVSALYNFTPIPDITSSLLSLCPFLFSSSHAIPWILYVLSILLGSSGFSGSSGSGLLGLSGSLG